MSENIEQKNGKNNEQSTETMDLNELLKVRRQKLSELQSSGKDPFKIVKFDVNCSAKHIVENYDEMEGKTVSIAGRLMSKRGMGKVGFCDLQDRDGKIQLYVRVDGIGEESYNEFKKFDIGDIVGVTGEVFKTKTGETSIKVKEITLLSKSLQVLPEKWHGLKDMDLRYRQRYVDLIINPDVRNTFIIRSKIIKAVREFLDNRGFLEVDTLV
jgi:lysyl-tRNA synthetase class 2